ncbi:MAG: hypothetical protein WCT18_00625 [Patescibacteria group bacterium]
MQVLEAKDWQVAINDLTDDGKVKSGLVTLKLTLSAEAIAQSPTHLIVVDNSEVEYESSFGHKASSSFCGIVHAFDLSKGLPFFEFIKSGRHWLQCFLVKDDAILHVSQIEKMDLDSLSRKLFGYGSNLKKVLSTACFVENIEVPPHIFAQKPDTWFGKRVWDAVNFLEDDPINSCKYKRRIIWFILFNWTWKLACALLGVVIFCAVAVIGFLLGYKIKSSKSQNEVFHDFGYLKDLKDDKPLSWYAKIFLKKKRVVWTDYIYWRYPPIVWLLLIGFVVFCFYYFQSQNIFCDGDGIFRYKDIVFLISGSVVVVWLLCMAFVKFIQRIQVQLEKKGQEKILLRQAKEEALVKKYQNFLDARFGGKGEPVVPLTFCEKIRLYFIQKKQGSCSPYDKRVSS